MLSSFLHGKITRYRENRVFIDNQSEDKQHQQEFVA